MAAIIIIIICRHTQALYTGSIIFVVLKVVKILAPFYWVAVELKGNAGLQYPLHFT